MAASLSRPDPASPASVAEAGFSTSRRGYNTDEVRAFLTSVAAEMSRLKEHERQLEAELRAARNTSQTPAELDDDTVASLLGEETLRVLQTARESASQIKLRAEETAARTLREAHDDANRARQEAEIDSARRRQDAQSEAEAEVALAKQQGREMVNEARAYRERVLADLERRTKLARQHIEELAQGRDRLIQVFERARIVAGDVTSDLQSFVGPEEFVNFAPTTGPVPLMVPAAAFDRPAAAAADDTTAALAIYDTEADPDDEIVTADASETDAAGEGTPIERELAEIADEPVEAAVAIDVPEVPEVPEVADAVEPAADAPAPRDTNVVSLFRDRAAGDEPADRPDVDGIFARLRSGDAEPHALEPAEGAVVTAAEPEVEREVEREDEPEPVAEAEVSDEVEATPFTRRDEAIVPLILTAARKLKRVLADEQNGVLDTLRRKEPVVALDAVAPEPDTHVDTYVNVLADELAAAAAAGAAELGANDTKTLRRTLQKAGALDAATALVRTDLVSPLRDRLERAIVEGAGDNDDITRRIRGVYREWKTQHIDDQLDDVFRYAFGGGLAVTIEPGTALAWTIDPSQAACADCEDNSLAGAVASGESFPTGHTSAPAHPGCRCLTLPAQQ
jgi:DivIVA domain-containing protein